MGKPRRRAFSLLELLTVVSIVGILLSLLLSAVQSARESARRVQCLANLRQIGLATQGYVGTWGTFPLGEMPGSLSPNVAILPYLEQEALYADFNFIVLPGVGKGVGAKVPTWMGPAASTAAGARIAVFLCPSEPNLASESRPPHFQPSNYAWNSGTWWPETRSWNGLFGRSIRDDPRVSKPPDPPLGAVAPAACRDGLSSTLLAAEAALGPISETAPRSRVSDCYVVDGLDDRVPAGAAVSVCSRVDWRSDRFPWHGTWRFKGYPWVEGTLWRGWFNTLQPPNHACCVQGSAGLATLSDWWFMIKPASSYHPGKVDAVMADGSARSFPDTIDRAVWKGLSTRAGGEALDGY